MTALEVTKKYFELSNNRRLDEVFVLFAEDATYSSDNTGLYFGVSEIRQMMTGFFNSFPELFWEATTIEEVKPNIVEVSFTLKSTDKTGKQASTSGIERVVVVNDKIRHIEVRNV